MTIDKNHSFTTSKIFFNCYDDSNLKSPPFALFSSKSDEKFAETEIIKYLEKSGFKICWHERDFMPGTSVAENIADAIKCSRRMILVFSR